MKKMMVILLSLLVSSCEKEDSYDEYLFEAEILGRNTDCGIYAVKILNGLSQVQSIIGSKVGDSIYIAENLQPELKIAGLKIMLDVRKPQNDELGACTTLGPAYYWIHVKRAEKKETLAKD